MLSMAYLDDFLSDVDNGDVDLLTQEELLDLVRALRSWERVGESRTWMDADGRLHHRSCVWVLTYKILVAAVLSETVQHELLKTSSETVKSALVKRDDLARSTQVMLLHDEVDACALTLCLNPVLEPDLQLEALEMYGPRAASLLAKNPGIAPEAQNRMLGDSARYGSERYLLQTLARNPGASPTTQRKVLDLGDEWLLESLALNPSTTPEVLICLLELDEGPFSPVMQRPDLPAEVQWSAFRLDSWTRTLLARRRDLDVKVAEALSYSEDDLVLSALTRKGDWTDQVAARFLAGYQVEIFETMFAPQYLEAARALAPNWSGSIATLNEAVRLVSV